MCNYLLHILFAEYCNKIQYSSNSFLPELLEYLSIRNGPSLSRCRDSERLCYNVAVGHLAADVSLAFHLLMPLRNDGTIKLDPHSSRRPTVEPMLKGGPTIRCRSWPVTRQNRVSMWLTYGHQA